jgi:hypothetical protein
VVQALPSKWTEFDISTSSLFTLSDTSKKNYLPYNILILWKQQMKD